MEEQVCKTVEEFLERTREVQIRNAVREFEVNELRREREARMLLRFQPREDEGGE